MESPQDDERFKSPRKRRGSFLFRVVVWESSGEEEEVIYHMSRNGSQGRGPTRACSVLGDSQKLYLVQLNAHGETRRGGGGERVGVMVRKKKKKKR